MIIKSFFKLGFVSAVVMLLNINHAQAQTNYPDLDVSTVTSNYMGAQIPSTKLEPLGYNLMGDHHDIDTGSLSFRHVDVSIPGNFALPVEFARRSNGLKYMHGSAQRDTLGNGWDVDLPYVRMRSFSGQSGNCYTSVGGPGTRTFAYNVGTKVNIPGQGEQSANPNLKSFWLTQCKAGGGLLVKSPKGDVYEMTKKIIRPDGYPVRSSTGTGNEDQILDNVFWYVTKVTDIHDNWVKYSYNSYGVDKIWSKDGREISISYDGDLIDSVTANGRSWTYDYNHREVQTPYGLYLRDYLSRVTLPDGRYWSFGENEGGMTALGSPSDSACNQVRNTGETFGFAKYLRHPSGTTARFGTKLIWNTIAGAPSAPFGGSGSPCAAGNITPQSFAVYALSSKRITTTDGESSTWIYDYDADPARSDDEKTRSIVSPEGHKTVHHINRKWFGPQGLTMKVEQFETASSSTPLRVETTEGYVEQTFQNYGDVGLHGANRIGNTHSLPTKKTITENGDSYTIEYEYDFDENSSTYAFIKPVKVTKYSDISPTHLVTDIVYEHKFSQWILGLTKSVSVTGDSETRQTVSHNYNAKGQVVKTYRYGQEVAEYNYNTSNGLLQWAEDALNRRIVTSSWKRGKPQSITRPDNTTISSVINDNGWLESRTDAKGITTSYEYNDMGWLTWIRPHHNTAPTVTRIPTRIKYFHSPQYLTQFIDRGYEREVVRYDSLHRPFEEISIDRLQASYSYVTTKYDAQGRVSFKSFPSEHQNFLDGTDFIYDALGRMKSSVETVGTGATTLYDYLSDNRTAVTDAEGHTTTTWRNGYSGPGGGEVIKIEQPEDTTTLINRNIFDEIESVTQFGAHNGYNVSQTQTFTYDDRRRLCRHYTPETGSVLYGYNDADEITSHARVPGNGTSCVAPYGDTKVDLTYDAMGRPENTLFADPATKDIFRDYDDNGNLTLLTRGVSTEDNWVRHFYDYDDYNDLAGERLIIREVAGDANSQRIFDVDYYRDVYGHLRAKRLPSGRLLPYKTDSRGRTMRVGFIDNPVVHGGANNLGIQYHPTSDIAEMYYGNGQRLTQTLNDRRLIDTRKADNLVDGGNVTAIDLNYVYDLNGRITDQIDGVSAAQTRTYTYDGQGRLRTAKSDAFGNNGQFNYDSLGNIRRKVMNRRIVTMDYDGNNRLISANDTRSGLRTLNYDGRGNVTKLGNLNFIYDMANQPRTVYGQNTDGENIGAQNDNYYVYDGNMKRVKSVTDGRTIFNVYDAMGKLVHVEEGDDPETPEVEYAETDYIHANGMTVARIKNGVTTYLHPDHLGSAQSGTTETGTVDWSESYTPFGETLINAAVNDNQAGFTGHIKDAETGLNYMQARYYDPVIGRFLSIDPVTFMDTGAPAMFNRYVYANNDPINMFDPDGNAAVAACAVPPVAAGCAAVGKAVVEGLILVGGVILIDQATNATPITLPSSTAEPYVTPGGREVAHGKKSKEYIEGKGWTPEEIDEVLDDPTESYGSKENHRTGKKQTTHVDGAGNWITVDEDGKITQVNEKGNDRQPRPDPVEDEHPYSSPG